MPVKQRFKNIVGLKFGADEFNTIKEVQVEETTEELTDSGDNDTEETFLEKGINRCRFTLLIADPIQAQAIKAHAKAAITFDGEPSTGGTACTYTLAGALVFNRSQRAMHNGVHVTQLSGRATSLAVAAAGGGGGA